MRPPWNARLAATGAVAFGLIALAAKAQDEPKANAPRADAKAQADGKFASRKELNDHYEERFADLDKQRIADMAALAPRLKDQESEGLYYELFNLAVTREQYGAAEKAAEAFLQSGKGTPQTKALASFVNIIAATNRSEYEQAVQDLDLFLKGMAGAGTDAAAIDPNLTFAVGESFLQRLIRAREYDTARRVARTFIEGTADPNIKGHFAGRLDRIERLGRPAPPIAANDVDGKPVNLADYQGKVILVDFWATWAPPCVAQMPYYNALQEKYGPQGFQVLGVNVDNAHQGVREKGSVSNNVRQFLLALRVGWPNVLNGTGGQDFARAYGVTDIPANFLIDRDGKIIQVELSDSDLDKAIERALGGEKAGEPAAKTGRPQQPTTAPKKTGR